MSTTELDFLVLLNPLKPYLLQMTRSHGIAEYGLCPHYRVSYDSLASLTSLTVHELPRARRESPALGHNERIGKNKMGEYMVLRLV